MAAKYPLPQRWHILRKQFLDAFNLQPIIEGMFLICGRRG